MSICIHCNQKAYTPWLAYDSEDDDSDDIDETDSEDDEEFNDEDD